MTKLQKTKITNRKFYNKWLYKITLKVNGAGMFRISSLEEIKDFCNSNEEQHSRYSYASRSYQHKDEILRLAEFLEGQDPKIWTKRIETSMIDFYTNDQKFYEQLSTDFEDVLIHRFEPDSNNLNLLENQFSIVVKKYPHNTYKYRVYLSPHKLAGDKEAKTKYIEWVKNQGPRIRCTSAVEKWFMTTDWNWDRRYILVEDEQTLLMLKLRNAEVMGKVYNFIISDK